MTISSDEQFHKMITTISSSIYGEFINQKLELWYDSNLGLHATGDSLTLQSLVYLKELCKEYHVNV